MTPRAGAPKIPNNFGSSRLGHSHEYMSCELRPDGVKTLHRKTASSEDDGEEAID